MTTYKENTVITEPGIYSAEGRSFYLDPDRVEATLFEDNAVGISWDELSPGLQRGIVRALLHEMRQRTDNLMALRLQDSIKDSKLFRLEMQCERLMSQLDECKGTAKAE